MHGCHPHGVKKDALLNKPAKLTSHADRVTENAGVAGLSNEKDNTGTGDMDEASTSARSRLRKRAVNDAKGGKRINNDSVHRQDSQPSGKSGH